MKMKGYTTISKEDFLDALKNKEEIEVFTTLEALFDVHGIYEDYNEIEFEDENYDISLN
jgi:hypothetical protein